MTCAIYFSLLLVALPTSSFAANLCAEAFVAKPTLESFLIGADLAKSFADARSKRIVPIGTVEPINLSAVPSEVLS
ncbi:MAG: hypothetical protein EOP06_10690, partial [Proteobacteria bacterium]